MIKVFVNRDVVEGPWGGGNHFLKAFNTFSGDFGIEITDTALNCDAVLVMGHSRDSRCFGFRDAVELSVKTHGRVKIISRINENDARKGTTGVDQQMREMCINSSGTIFVSNWLKDYMYNAWITQLIIEGQSLLMKLLKLKHDSSVVVHNGVDKEVFRRRLNLRIYDCHRLRIVAHHWSDNFKKGADFYSFLDEYCDTHHEYLFHYIGRPPVEFKGRNTRLTPPKSGNELGEALSSDEAENVYISASRHDPGPNHVTEALATGLETYVHVDGGGCVEFAGTDHTFSTTDDLLKILERKMIGVNRPNSFVPTDWRDCIEKYCSYIEQVVTSS